MGLAKMLKWRLDQTFLWLRPESGQKALGFIPASRSGVNYELPPKQTSIGRERESAVLIFLVLSAQTIAKVSQLWRMAVRRWQWKSESASCGGMR